MKNSILFQIQNDMDNRIIFRPQSTIEQAFDYDTKKIEHHIFRDILDISDSIYLLNRGKLHLTKSIADLEILGYARF